MTHFLSLSSFKTTSSVNNGDFQLKAKRKKEEGQKHSKYTKNVKRLVGFFLAKRHLLIRCNLKFDFNIRTSTCYITTLTLLHSTPFINFPFVNITKLTDPKKTLQSFIVRYRGKILLIEFTMLQRLER